MPENVVVDIYGKFACFTRSNAKVERVSYDAPTPSACRGALEAIYFKPGEFHYQIKKIEIMKPIRYINIKRNEVNKKAVLDGEPIIVEESRTQRNNIYLRDVYYRIHAEIIKEKGCEERVTQQSLIDQSWIFGINARTYSKSSSISPFAYPSTSPCSMISS